MSLNNDLNQPLDEVDVDRVGTGGAFFPKGQYHVQINSVDSWAGKNKDQTLVQLECLAGNVSGTVGLQHNEYFSMKATAYGRLLQLAIATRLTTREEIKKAKEENRKPNINWDAIIGRQILVVLEDEEYDGKVRAKINFNIFDVDDPKYAHIPKNQEFLTRFQRMCPAPANGVAKPAPVTQPAAVQGGEDMFA